MGVRCPPTLRSAAALCGIAIRRVRVWNPSREVRRVVVHHDDQPAPIGTGASRIARFGHLRRRRLLPKWPKQREPDMSMLESGTKGPPRTSREVWDNPILWREMRTWAYGRKVLAIRVAYLLLAVMAGLAVRYITADYGTGSHVVDDTSVIPRAATALVPLYVLSLVILNALAVTSVTTERDGKHLDLLLATDLSPSEFLFGKLGGTLSVAGLMVGAPLVLSSYLWWAWGN